MIPAILALVPLLAPLIPGIGRLLAGPRGEETATQVAAVVQGVAGALDRPTVAAALADPEKAGEIVLGLARLELEAETARLADVASARGQTVSLAQAGSSIAWAAPVMSAVVTVGFFACTLLLMWSDRIWDERTASQLNMLFGALIAGFSQVTSYWLGSSAGSKRSGDAVREIATQRGGQTQPTAIATTGDVKVGETTDELNARLGGLQR